MSDSDTLFGKLHYIAVIFWHLEHHKINAIECCSGLTAATAAKVQQMILNQLEQMHCSKQTGNKLQD